MFLVTAYAALSLLLLVIGERLPTGALRSVGAFVYAPFDRIVLSGDRMLASWRENRDLHQRIAGLEAENSRLREAAAENRRLRAQLDLPVAQGLALQAVEVLALGGDPLPTSATLSAGARNGLHVGDAVLTSDGLVGRVSEVYATMARASLLTDPNLAVACVVETTGVNGVLRFTLSPSPRLLVTAVPLADTIRVGETLVTSDLSVRFPRGIPVGRVTRIRRDATGLMQEIEVSPAAQLSRLRHAFIAPGPVPPTDGLTRPRLAFEPPRIAGAARGGARIALTHSAARDSAGRRP